MRVTVAGHPKFDVPRTLASIFKQAGWKYMRFAIVIEKSENGFGAYVPDLPGCIAVGETIVETETLINEAISFHLTVYVKMANRFLTNLR